jgi:hypothetical protein
MTPPASNDSHGSCDNSGTNHSCTYLETSALTGEGIDIAFDTFIDELIARKSSFEEKEEGQQGRTLSPTGPPHPRRGAAADRCK